MDETISQLCNDLNLDQQTADNVSKTFSKVGEQFIVEGDKTHWLACVIYATTNTMPTTTTSTTNTTNNNQSTASTNNTNSTSNQTNNITTSATNSATQAIPQTSGVSLTRLLRLCKLSLVDFFNLMDKWLKMTDQTGSEIRSRISHLERNFNVSAVVFKKYKEIFPDVFKPISAKSKEQSDKQLNRTRKSTANARLNYEVTTADIYYFCWVLYINVKAKRPAICEDLVNSYHLLLACIDFCYSNALVSKFAHDVLNPNFKGLPENFQSEDFKLLNPTKQPLCILQVLCDSWDGIVVNAKGIREHWLKPYIKELVSKKTLQVTCTNEPPNTFLGVFDGCNFESNMSKLTKEHDLTMLTMGDFDERIFLSENAHKELGAPVYDLSDLKQMINERDSANQSSPHKNSSISAGASPNEADSGQRKPSLENGGLFVPQTPLSNRCYMANRTAQPSSPVANATRKVGDLYRMLTECTGEPTASLEDIFKLCTQNPRRSIMERASRMVDTFVGAYTSNQDESQAAIELARKQADLARKLYFKVLETIIVREQKRLPTDKIGDSLSSLLSHEIFHISLFVCCVEIVLASHNATRLFPWSLEVYKNFGETTLYPWLFYRVIELVIREEERLSRDIVKHLASIEERVLDSMAWESDSPLWTVIAANGSIPSCQDVVLPASTNDQNPFELSPLSSLRRHEGFHSPMPVSGRYSITPLDGGARRRLFDPPAVVQSAPGQPQILHFMPQRSENGDIKYVIFNPNPPDSDHSMSQSQDLEHSPTPIRPAARANPVNLFFRKVYYLAQLRFRDLWNTLSINSIELQRKIWTLFEDQIRNHTNLLRDRHLDQMIMCATYAVIKVCNTDNTSVFFKDIIRAYRSQPQAKLENYKHVLLSKPPLKLLDDSAGAPATRTTPTMPTRSPSRRAAVMSSPIANNGTNQSSSGTAASSSSSSGTTLPERGDVIQFYNQLYVPQVRNIMIRFATRPDSSLSLSPLPRMNTHPISPWRRVSQQHSVYVSPLKSNSVPSSPGRQLSYNFHRSPAKDLQIINNMVNRQRAVCKRILQDDDGENTKRQCT